MKPRNAPPTHPPHAPLSPLSPSSPQSGLSAAGIAGIVLLCCSVVVVGGYAAYRLRLRGMMQAEVRAIMAQYMALPGDAGETGGGSVLSELPKLRLGLGSSSSDDRI